MDITLNIANTAELKKAVEIAIKESGYTKSYIAEQLGINNQNFNRFLNKKNLSIDDVNSILSIIGYEIKVTIEKV